jgi:hypothetical protein
VPERLETVLKQEAKKQRLSVSHLIRNVLEDALALVDNVVAGGEELVEGSVRIAEQVARDARKLAASARGTPTKPRPPEAPEVGVTGTTKRVNPRRSRKLESDRSRREPARYAARARGRTPRGEQPAPALGHVLAWNEVVLNRTARCARCASELAKGTRAHLGLSRDPTEPAVWLCSECLAQLAPGE